MGPNSTLTSALRTPQECYRVARATFGKGGKPVGSFGMFFTYEAAIEFFETQVKVHLRDESVSKIVAQGEPAKQVVEKCDQVIMLQQHTVNDYDCDAEWVDLRSAYRTDGFFGTVDSIDCTKPPIIKQEPEPWLDVIAI